MRSTIKVSVTALFLLTSTLASLGQPDFHVAPSGNDKNPGTQAKPFRTITRARDVVAKVNAKMTGDISVHLAGGIYPISEPIVFGPKDSGRNGHRVIYKAVEGESPIISGGNVIKGWQLHDKEKGIYKASVGGLEFRQIYVNGRRGVRARTPNRISDVTLEGFLRGASVTGKKPHHVKLRDAAEIKGWEAWTNLKEVEMVMITHWKQKRARIAKIEGNAIYFQEPENQRRAMHHLEQPGTPHWYENAYEFIDAEGEFYLNTQTDTLFYKPRAGEDMTKVEVVVPTVETLLDIKGESPEKPVSDLVFEGIIFEYSNWTGPNHKGYTIMQSATHYGDGAMNMDPKQMVPAAIELGNASGVEIRSCTIRRTGAHGIAAMIDVVSGCSFVGNHVKETSAGGVYLLLNHEGSSGNQVTDNTIERIGMEYSDGCGILVARTPDVSIVHNEIRDVRYTGITTGWSWNDKDTPSKNHEVAHNLIHRTMGLHDDGGGIYTLGKIPGMKIHHNYIHSIKRSKFAGNWGIAGIYLDNGSCQKLVQDNVIDGVEVAFFSGNKPNYDNTFERNYHNVPLAKVIEKTNVVRDNVEVKKTGKTTPWPKAALDIMKSAGPRGEYRRPEK